MADVLVQFTLWRQHHQSSAMYNISSFNLHVLVQLLTVVLRFSYILAEDQNNNKKKKKKNDKICQKTTQLAVNAVWTKYESYILHT